MIFPLDISRWVDALARKILYSWVRPQVFPAAVAELGLDPAKPVCYVLQDRRYSNILVLLEQTLRASLPPAQSPFVAGTVTAARSFFFMTRAQALIAPAQHRYGHSPLLIRMVKTAMSEPGLDVQLVPVTILWGRSPGSQDSILKALFAETWRPPGHLRQIIAVLLHGRDLQVRFNAPLSLREFVDEGLDEARTLRKLSRTLRVHFRRQRQIAIGPDISHRHTQVETLLATPAVRRAIAAEAAEAGISESEAEAEARARKLALEIPSDFSYGVVRAMELFLNWLWTHLYDGVEVHNFEVVNRIAPGQGIVYLPCHRSHIDYLLLSFLIFQRGLRPPHIAAGANLNMPIIGPLLRRGGAFFLRRSFKGEPLYAAIFHEYLHLLLSRGFPIEYFIEGGRSRSGRMLAPRTGILGMTVRSYLRDHAHPLVFIPVYVGYEKLLEGRSFVAELEGKPKSRESLWSLISTVRQIRREFGRVHVNFGRPLALGEFLDGLRPGWAERDDIDPRADWVRDAIHAAADEMTRRINEAAVVNPINLMALALLGTPKHSIDEFTLHRMIAHYQALQTEAPYGPSTTPCVEATADVVASALRLGAVERVSHPLGDLIRVQDSQAALLAYFRNNVLHLFALPAVIACLVGQSPCLEGRRLAAAVTDICLLLRAELFLRWRPEDLPAVLEGVLAVMVARGLVRRSGDQLAAPEANSQEFAELRLLGETIRPTLERHLLMLALLQRHGSGRLTRKGLEESGHLLAQRLAMLYEFNSPEFSEKSLFAGVVGNLLGAGLLVEGIDGRLLFDERISAPAEHTELLLPAEVRQAVRRMAATEEQPG
jgi:glycerol-3-phosphate O-acyltransferase